MQLLANEEDIRALSTYSPVVIFHPDGSTEVRRYISGIVVGNNSNNKKSINIYQPVASFSNPVDLFEHLLTRSSPVFAIGDNYRQCVFDAFQHLYLSPPPYRTGYTIQHHIIIEESFHSILCYKPAEKITSKPNIITQINTAIMSLPGFPYSVPKTYEEALCCLEALPRYMPRNDFILFPSESYKYESDNHLIVWMLHYLVDRGIIIKRCLECGHLFETTPSRNKFCSAECKKNYTNLGRYFNDPEYKKRYNKLHKLLATRENQNKNGLVYHIEKENFKTPDYDRHALFVGLLSDTQSGSKVTISQAEVSILLENARVLLTEHYERYLDIVRRYQKHLITLDEYEVARKAFLAYVDDLHLQILCLKPVRTGTYRAERQAEQF